MSKQLFVWFLNLLWVPGVLGQVSESGIGPGAESSTVAPLETEQAPSLNVPSAERDGGPDPESAHAEVPLPDEMPVQTPDETRDQTPTTPVEDPIQPTEEPTLRTRLEFGEGLSVETESFSLRIRGRMQLLVAMSNTDGTDDVTTEVMARRVRLAIGGHLLTHHLRYYFQFGFAARDVETDFPMPLRDAYLEWQPVPSFALRVGQMKVPYGLQRVISSSALAFADRGLTIAEFNLDRDVGLMVMSDDLGEWNGRLRYRIGAFGGQGRNRFGAENAVLLAARVQVLPFGEFDVDTESDFDRSDRFRIAVGASAAYNIHSRRQRSTFGDTFADTRFDYVHLGADLHVKYLGLALLSEFMFRGTERARDPLAMDGVIARQGYGVQVQLGWMLPEVPLEVVGRYSYQHAFAESAGSGLFTMHEVSGGLNYFLLRHNLKVQADYAYLPLEAGPRIHRVRVQVQMFF